MINRRRFLKGVGGAALALPILESVRWVSRASAALPTKPVYSFFIRQGNGVQQAGYSDEPERFWPRTLGTLTKNNLATADSDRTLSILADHADKLTFVRGTRFGFPPAGCGHANGLNQCLTAARFRGEDEKSLADGESVDWFIAQRLNPDGIEPLTLMSGPQAAYIAHGLSYSGPAQLRGAKNNPFAVYTSLMGLGGSSDVLQQIAMRRKSVNDLVRDEMKELLGNPELSTTDRLRLETHFAAIRDVEVGMACTLPGSTVSAMQAISTVFE